MQDQYEGYLGIKWHQSVPKAAVQCMTYQPLLVSTTQAWRLSLRSDTLHKWTIVMTPWAYQPHLQPLIRHLQSVPDCSSVVTARAFVTVNLLIERFEMSVYYYYYYSELLTPGWLRALGGLIISSVLRQLHWLLVWQRVVFKIMMLVSTSPCPAMLRATWSTTVNWSPTYLSRQPHSANTWTLTVNQTYNSFGERTFAAEWNQNVEQFAARSETTVTVIRPVQADTEDIFIWTVRPWHSLNSFNCAD